MDLLFREVDALELSLWIVQAHACKMILNKYGLVSKAICVNKTVGWGL